MTRSSIVAMIGFFCALAACASNADAPAAEGDAQRVWEAVQGYEGWAPVSHQGEIQIYTEDLNAIDGQFLTEDVEPGTFVVCEQSVGGEVEFLETFESLEVDEGWRRVRFTADGVHIPDTFRAIAFQCGDCHLGRG